MAQVSTAGRLLAELHGENPGLRDAIAAAAGITAERADASMIGGTRLSLAEQLRLAEAAMVMAPRFSRSALRLRGQALAARSFEEGDVQRRQEAPVERWERSAQMRR